GVWGTKYVPAFIRRYPFVFASNDDGKTFTACIDEEYIGCNQQGLGERLFDTEGEQTQYLGGVLEFLKAYQIQFQRTQIFCKKLQELELLEPMQAQFEPKAGGGKVSLSGFMAVSRERVKKLSGDKLAELAATDELELMYLHLQSMRNISQIAQRMGTQIATEDKSKLEGTAEDMGDVVTH
ncbi:MAG: SapC family protein, partial [Gammaproteobacteria bacterium]|nr:SapC family protein [Gammaproteobacteria bacterium]NNJ85436.1 SapC family protein [Gammaproteobacteria bacterium]